MKVGEICSRQAIVAYTDEPIRTAARLMRQHHVGDVIVVEDRQQGRVPVGIVTDRDLVIKILQVGVDPDVFVLGDLMTGKLLTVHEDDALEACLHRMHERGVRRAPVLDDEGALVGVLSLDDVIELVAEEMTEMSGLLRREREHERDTQSG
ncbi:MAG: CBS domain-containing protein [Halofilum sp. (in: g-proteobacteria)]|nr:CBS domain-containing protein [Halofilum sp. (in: g-proteobacteria)]